MQRLLQDVGGVDTYTHGPRLTLQKGSTRA
jgi:hypothetical protein